MTRILKSTVSIVCLMLLSALCLSARPGYTVDYPKGYRSWTHVMSYVIGPQSPAYARNGGLHNFYANDKALEGYRTGKFPDGSMMVDERNKAEESDGVTRLGDWLGVGVMVKDSARYGETGGWGFEIFSANNQTAGVLTEQGRATCYNCHAKRKDNDFVFTSLRK